MKCCNIGHAKNPATFTHCPHDGSVLMEASEWKDGAVIRGKYRVLGKLGQDGSYNPCYYVFGFALLSAAGCVPVFDAGAAVFDELVPDGGGAVEAGVFAGVAADVSSPIHLSGD